MAPIRSTTKKMALCRMCEKKNSDKWEKETPNHQYTRNDTENEIVITGWAILQQLLIEADASKLGGVSWYVCANLFLAGQNIKSINGNCYTGNQFASFLPLLLHHTHTHAHTNQICATYSHLFFGFSHMPSHSSVTLLSVFTKSWFLLKMWIIFTSFAVLPL